MWEIRNSHYYHEGLPTRKKKWPPEILTNMDPKPWVAICRTPNYYEARLAKRFWTVEEAIAYALRGGDPITEPLQER